MPQGALQANIATNPSNARAPLVVDALGNQLVASAKSTSLNVTGGAAVLVKGSAGRLVRISVTATIAGSLTVNDAATTGAAAAGNLVYSAATPAAGTVVYLDWPCANGIVVTPGTSGSVAVSYA